MIELFVQLSPNAPQSSAIDVKLSEDNPLIADVLLQVKSQLNPWQLATLQFGIAGLESGIESMNLDLLSKKFTIYLAILTPTGPMPLEEMKRVEDYGLSNGDKLYLMCASSKPVA
jgi:hypothetical protein